MWFKEYRDYPTDRPLVKEPVSPGHGIIGCEMHDLNGWGTEHHDVIWSWKARKKGRISTFLARLFNKKG